MSESGHSQPGMYGQSRRRRRRRGEREVGPPGQNLSGPSRDREYQPRERRVLLHTQTHTNTLAHTHRHIDISEVEFSTITSRFVQDGSEDPPGPLIQKTPIILAKPPAERVCCFHLYLALVTVITILLELLMFLGISVFADGVCYNNMKCLSLTPQNWAAITQYIWMYVFQQ